MTRADFSAAQHRIVNINELAYRTGFKPDAVRRAGEALFTSLAGNDPDLSKALIAASSASGVEPKHMIAILGVLASEFRATGTGTVEGSARPAGDRARRGALARKEETDDGHGVLTHGREPALRPGRRRLMARAMETYADNRGNLHRSVSDAVLSDIAMALGRVGDEGGMTIGVARLIFEKRTEIERAFADFDRLNGAEPLTLVCNSLDEGERLAV